MTLTLFSTKAFKKTDLFGERITTTNSEAVRALNHFFLHSLLIRAVSSENISTVQKIIIDQLLLVFGESVKKLGVNLASDDLPAIMMLLPNERERKVLIFEIVKKASQNVSSNEDEINNEIEKLFDEYDDLSILLADVENNKDEIIDGYLKELPSEKIQQLIGKTSDVHEVYRVENASDVYGVKCLETSDYSGKWIECLLQCALNLAPEAKDSIVLQLVLHDKDIPGYAEKDVTVIESTSDEMLIVAPKWKEIRVGGKSIEKLTIVFFHHTSNEIARIVENPYDGKDINIRVGKFIEDYIVIKNKVTVADNELYQ